MKARATYFDGLTSARQEVTLDLEGSQLLVSGPGIELALAVTALRLSSPVGAARRALYLPGGALCEVDEGPFAEQLARAAGQGSFFRCLHRGERNLKIVALALTLVVVVIWGLVQFGIPRLAKRVAWSIPPATETVLGRETLAILEQAALRPSALPEKRQTELGALFAKVATDLAPDRSFTLILRAAPRLGANALALPGGTVIVTDALVDLATHDEEIAAVLAHEVAHVQRRHALQQALQNSASALLVATLTGDLLSATSLAATLPTVLVNSRFSRAMETEADAVAAGYLARHGIPLERFSAILLRLQAEHDRRAAEPEESGKSIADYFSTHPATGERVENLRGGKTEKSGESAAR